MRDGVRKRRVPLAAVDGTGLESRHTSRYYVKRRASSGDRDQITTYAKYPKVVFVVDCSSHMILAAVPGRGPGSDLVQFGAAWGKQSRHPRIETLLADADFDAEWVHARCQVARHSDDHPGHARAADRQAAVGALATADETAIRPIQAEVRAKVAGGDSELDDQATIRLRAASQRQSRSQPPETIPEGHDK